MNHVRIHLHPSQQKLQYARTCQTVGAENVQKYQVKEIAVYKGNPVSFIQSESKKNGDGTGYERY
jgi:hypothetical protein